jgi:hypothetical protein
MIMRHSKSYLIVIVMTLLSISIPVLGQTGSIRIDPPLPEMSSSLADFEIWAQSGVANDPHILLVITEACYDELTGNSVVNWTGGFSTIKISDWNGPESSNNDKFPLGTTNGANYTVASLQDHLDTDDPIYWAFDSILGGAQLTSEKKLITVTLLSDDPDMLVYILCKSPESELFDMRVPPTIPGFFIPEIPFGTIMVLVSMIAALAIYAKRPSLAVLK